jgi:hypothetical protein
MRPVLYILETGLGISQSNRDADSQWNLFHNGILFETNQSSISNPNVMLKGQRSSMAAASKRRALALYFPVKICHMLEVSRI